MKRLSIGLILSLKLLVFLTPFSYLYAAELKSDVNIIDPVKISIPIKIDGELNEELWNEKNVISKEFISFNPLRGQLLPYKTDMWMGYDNENLYFAFYCHDPEPEKIKTSVSQRDKIYSDDWVAVALDTQGNRQSSYQFYINPDGIQADALTTVSNNEDNSPDWVWKSAGKIIEDGYCVEVCVPLKSISFKSGKETLMGIIFARKISRHGLSGSWPEVREGETILKAQTNARLKNLENKSNIEFLPSITYDNTKELKRPGEWANLSQFNKQGIGLKYAMTSAITLESTINPDFSQVESDQFQVTVNQKYPVFYSEKRPFFTEAQSFFNISGTGGNSLMQTAVHTRRIVEPDLSAKLIGSSDKTSFGILVSKDSWKNPNKINIGKNNLFTIARGKYSIKDDNYFGGIYSGHDISGGYNHTGGLDGSFRYGKNSLSCFFLGSVSKNTENKKEKTGDAVNLTFQRDTRGFIIFSVLEQFSPDFEMDTAFYRRKGVNRGQLIFGPNFYPYKDKDAWLKKVSIYAVSENTHDLKTGMDDTDIGMNLQMQFTKQGYFNIQRFYEKEAWAGKYYFKNNYHLSSGMQASKWIWFGGYYGGGKGIYYNQENPFLGNSLYYGLNFTLQPGVKLSQTLGFSHSQLERPWDRRNQYSVDIVNTRTTYQFNKYFFLRATFQYSSGNKTLLKDYLASCTYIPGTVVHIGYGELSQRSEWNGSEWSESNSSLRTMKRSLFCKASYLYRF